MSKILVIDDEKDFTFFVKANLELEGEHKVEVANNGKDGIKAAEHHRPDVILLDIMMPGLSGLDTLKLLKEKETTFQVPVIMLTAKGDEDSKMMAATMFNEDYIVKPVEIEVLKAKIKSVIARRGGRRM
jgi:DNA-binding response OmpR family regulator